MKSKRSKMCDIPKSVKDKVWERDNHRCIICGCLGNPEAHIISRSRGGLGIEENIITLCRNCHQKLDQSPKNVRDEYIKRVLEYIKSKYPNWRKEDVTYVKRTR
jgi:5-methylcytosine-specific restriction endonuclease McrA